MIDHDSNRILTAPQVSAEAAGGTLLSVDKPGLTEEMVTRVRGLVEAAIKKHFPIPEGQRTNPGGQRAIAEAMHVSQAWLNQFRLGNKGVDINTLLSLRAYFAEIGEPKSLDEMLGLTDNFQERLARLEAQVFEARGSHPAPVPSPKRLVAVGGGPVHGRPAPVAAIHSAAIKSDVVPSRRRKKRR